jgi:hypothetical protein
MGEARPDAATRNKTKNSQCSWTQLRKASRRLSQLFDAALAPCGLRTTQRAILRSVSITPTIEAPSDTSRASRVVG